MYLFTYSEQAVPRVIWFFFFFRQYTICTLLKTQLIHASVHEDLKSHSFLWYAFVCYQGMLLLNAQTVWRTHSQWLVRDFLCIANRFINTFAVHSLNLNTENVLIILIVYKWKVFFVEVVLSFPFQVSEDTDNFH